MAGNPTGVVQTTRAIYDFTPFLPAQAVKDSARSAGMITTVAIPVTPCPSPLAANITPEQLANLKNHLTGPKSNNRGKEIWASWKRAWDLWNNNYIEGRVNPEWVKMEWDRRAKEKAKQGPRRHRYGKGILTPRSEPQVQGHWVGPQPPDTVPGTKWVKDRNEKKIVKTGRKLTRFVKTPKTIEAQKKAKPYRLAIKKFMPDMESQEETKESRTYPYFPIEHSWDDLEIARRDHITLNRPSDNQVQTTPESRLVDRVKVTTARVRMQLVKRMVRVPRNLNKLLSWSDMSQARLNNSTVIRPVNEANVIYDVVEKDIWEPVGQMVDSDEYKYIQNTESVQVTKLLDPTVQIVDEEEEYSEVEEQITSYWELVDDFDDPRPRPKKPKKLVDPKDGIASPPAESMDEGTGAADDNMEDQDDFMVIDDTTDDDDEEDDEWWIPKTEDDNGSSGGFFAIKDRDAFKEPPGEPWNDIINNTVWRPRWVGEKTLRIDEDEDEDDFLDDNDLTEDGGVDCGRRPYPVLRSTDNYYSVETPGQSALFKKREVWDGVTGTIFNMPTQPIESDDESEDERHILVRAMYSENLLPNPLAHQTDLFPLDIRRVNRQDAQACRITDVDENEKLIRYSWENPLKDYRHMEEDDPWFVTTEQEELRDVPPRRYPPPQSTYEGNHLIPVDDVNWVENRVMDEMGDSQYFVTNLHGGTLIINGQEVKKGQVAGPLPPFAVIESFGGQVSFWWGTRGRNWNQASRPAPEREWETLRQVAGWAYVGLKVGVVWDWKIKDRMKREEDGEDEDDDELWKNWKNPKSDEPDFEAMTDAEYGAYYGTQFMTDDYVVATDYGGDDIGPHKEIPPPEIFESEEAELKWIAFTAGQLQRLGDQVITSSIVEPSGAKFWSGPVKEDLPPGRITEAKLEQDWKKLEKGRTQYQAAALTVTKAKEQSELTQILDCRTKRRGDELSQEIIKKRRIDLDAEVKRLKAKQEKEEQDARETVAQAEKEEREKRKRKEVEAKRGAIEYEAKQGKTPEEFAAWKIVYQKEQDKQAQEAKAKQAAKTQQDQKDQAAVLAAKSDEEKAALVAAAAQKIRDDMAQAAKKKQQEDDKKALENEKQIAKQEDEKKLQDAKIAEDAQKKAEDEAAQKKADDEAAQKKANDAEAAKIAQAEKQKLEDEAKLTAQNPANAALKALGLTPGEEVQFNDWLVIKVKGGQIDFEQFPSALRTVYDKWEPWYNTHFKTASTSGVSNTRQQIADSLNARAFSEKKLPLKFIQDEGFLTINHFIDSVIAGNALSTTRLPPLTPRAVFDNGLQARATLENTTMSVIAKSEGFATVNAMAMERINALPQLAEKASLDDWKDYQQFMAEWVGNYVAEVEVVEKKVKEHEAGKILPATVPGLYGSLGIEF